MNQDNDGPTGPLGEVPKRRRIAEDDDEESDDDDDNNNNMDTEQIDNDNQVGAPSSSQQSTTTNNPSPNDEEEEDAELTKRQRIEARANERRRQRELQAEARDLLEASYPGDEHYVGKLKLYLLFILCCIWYDVFCWCFWVLFYSCLMVLLGVAMVGCCNGDLEIKFGFWF